MAVKWIFLAIFNLLLFYSSTGQVKKIKVAKEKIDIVGFWDASSPDSIIAAGAWWFTEDNRLARHDTIDDTVTFTDYSLDKNFLTFALGFKSRATSKFSIEKTGDRLTLRLKESNPPASSKIKTIILTKKVDKRIDADFTYE